MAERGISTANRHSGFTLVEMLIALSLMSFVAMSVVLALTKVNTMGTSLSQRNRAVLEIQSVFTNMRDAIASSSGVNKFSVSSKIILHNVDSGKKVYLQSYRILSQALEVSTNLQDAAETSATWNSPYNIAAASSYKITSGEFLYCGYGPNNCYRFPDGNANRRWDGTGTDGAIAWVSLNASAQGTALTSPEQARRVVLYNFTFDRQFGNPSVKRTLPNIAVKLGQKVVDPGPPNVAWTSSNPKVMELSLSSVISNFTAQSIFYDSSRRRLFVQGYVTSTPANKRIIVIGRDGSSIRDVANNITSPVALTSAENFYMALEPGTTTMHGVSWAAQQLYSVNLTTGAFTTQDISTHVRDNYSDGIVYDPSTPTSVHVIAQNTSNVWKLFEFNKSTGAVVGTPKSVPAGLTTATAMTMNPLTGDFYILNSTVNVSGGKSTIDIFRIDRANPTATDTFKINLTDLGATTTTGYNWDFTYDPETNHFFLLDFPQNKIYEFAPVRNLRI